MNEITMMLLPRVENLISRYVHCVDDYRLAEIPDFFTDDALYRIIPRRNYEQGHLVGIMECDGKGMIHDRMSSLNRANIFEPHRYRHMVSATVIRGAEGGEIRADTNFFVARIMESGEFSLFTTGVYRDVIVEKEGQLLFKERIVVCDSTRVDSLLALPI
ncbi:aromatic-ring-hydroxylating dioxygenase subunit beta [Telmatospirillum sp. J64-1]|uniref:aromatic-ring-hydroxylating dioxygenase subunit beta n=1 Tax=Telmatospirillum sp. J64-1 TaxID=2502183 RepID=UPI00163D7469|nr:aromatic-ring-hydroxylating dioxygenase subunit beta [Telmatospirillum sp. J64-1]